MVRAQEMIARAEELARRYPTAAEVLEYYIGLVRGVAPEPVDSHECGRAPLASVLRPEFDGARRYLVCATCHSEAPFPRIQCPACGENRFDELPVYTCEEFPHLRVEACETCKTYLLGVDIAKDPQAIPFVDELAAVSLNLWAHERGYRKLYPNLLGL